MGKDSTKWISQKLILGMVKDVSSFGSGVFFGIFTVSVYFFNPDLAYQLLIGFVLVMIIGYGIKTFVPTNRPDYKDCPLPDAFADKMDASSFPSIHSARATLIVCLLIPLSPFLFQVILIGLAIGVVASRVILKRHHIRDVIGGVILGLSTVFLLKFFF